jgi:hypothetical protein
MWDGIIIGSAGGAGAGIVLWLMQLAHTKYIEKRDKDRIYGWLNKPEQKASEWEYRTGRAIASWTNLPTDRVRYICSIDERIALSLGKNEDVWSLRE